MDSYHFKSLKFFTFSLPLLCLLSWSWAASSTATTSLPPASSALLAANTLRIRGYSLFASVIVSFSSTANFSGTLLVPPDFAFSVATAKFSNNHRPPPRPSVSLLLYHTLKPPSILTWPGLSSRDDGAELRTLYNNNCLYLFRSSSGGGEVSVFSSPLKSRPNLAVKVRQPDLYVDEHLTVHGIDGVLDPSFATKCSAPDVDSIADAGSRQVKRTSLYRAIMALRRRGYSVVAAAMAIGRPELLSLTSVTVFAVSDENLFHKPGGFRYDFRHHVLPLRHRIEELAKFCAGGRVELHTLAPNKSALIDSIDGAVTVNGVAVDAAGVYHNRWINVLSIVTSLDDIADSRGNRTIAGDFSDISTPSPSPIPGVSSIDDSSPTNSSPAPSYYAETENGIPSPAPVNISNVSVGTPSPAPDLDGGLDDYVPIIVSTIGSPSPAFEIEAEQNLVGPPALGPTTDDVRNAHCDFNGGVSVGVEGEDLLCPASTVRQLLETENLSGADVDESKPFIAYGQGTDDLTQFGKVKIDGNVNIADDVFFYI